MLKAKFGSSTKIYDVNFASRGPHVVELLGYVGSNTSGFTLYTEDGVELGDYSQFKTIYLNKEDSTIFSDDGSHYEPPKKDVVVKAVWQDTDHEYLRPDTLAVNVLVNGVLLETITLTAEDDWQYTYEHVLAEDVYTITCADVVQYNKEINGTTVTYSYAGPSVEERLDEVEGRLTTDEEVLAETFATTDAIVTEIIPEIVGI